MSTRSEIFIEIKPEDKNKTICFDPANNTAGIQFLNEKELVKWSKENPLTLDKDYVSIYCHCDGYPSHMHAALTSFFNDYEKALNLMTAGSMCSIGIKPESFLDTPAKTENKIIIQNPLFTEYVYLFKDKKWLVLKTLENQDWSKPYKDKPVTYRPEQFITIEEFNKKYKG